MPIDDARRLLFVHVPKNAGTSIGERLAMRALGHRTWHEYASDFPDEWARYRSFAVVRDPVERFLSNYRFARMERSYWHARNGGARHGRHPDHELCTRYSAREIASILAENPRALRHPGWGAQWPWFCDEERRVRVHVVIDHANLAAGLAGLGVHEELARVNVSEHDAGAPSLGDAALRDLVRGIYRDDQELFFTARTPADGGPDAPRSPARVTEVSRRDMCGTTVGPGDATIDAAIERLVPGLHFAEVGSLWATNTERLSLALRHGASSATKIDRVPLGHDGWRKLEARLASLGFPGRCNTMSLDLESLPMSRDHGLFDFVHCSGVIFHQPNPFRTLLKLRALTRRYLALGSMTVPELVRTPAGELDLRGGAMLFGPALRGDAREVMRQHCERMKLTAKNFEGATPVRWVDASGAPNEAPWWWFWTAETLASMAEAAGFRRVAIHESWPGRAHVVLLEVA